MLIGLKKLLLTQTAKDSGVLFIGSVIATFFGFLVVIILTRNLETSEFGLVITALVFTQLIADVSELGINSSVLNFVSAATKDMKQKYLKVTFLLRLSISLILSALLYILADPLSELFFNNKEMSPFIQISSIGILLSIIISWSQGVFQAQKQFIISALVGSSINVLRTLIIFLLLTMGFLSAIYAFFSMQAILIIIVVLVMIKIGLGFIRATVTPADFRKVTRFGLPVGLSFAVAAVYTKLDQILIFNLAGEEQAGIYGLAFRTASFLILVSASLNSAFTPRFASLHPADFNSYFKKTVYVSSGLGLLSLLTIPLSPYFFPLIFGEKFNEAVFPFQILVIGMFAFIIFAPFYSAIIYKFKQTKFPFLTSLFALGLVYILLNLFIPLYQSVGAAIAVTIVYISQLIFTISYFLYLNRKE